MSRAFFVILAATLLLSGSAYAQNGGAAGVAGAWDLAINGPEGPLAATATLKQDGEKVTGTIESPAGSADLSGTLKGKTLAMAFTIQSPNGPIDIKVTGEVDGASMKGVIDFGMGMADFTAKKK